MWIWMFWVSAAFNLLMILYVRWLLRVVETINTDIVNVSNLIYEFSSHTSTLHDLEMFYGDETLKSLIDHSRQLVEKLNDLDLIINEEEEDAFEAPETKED